MKVWKILLIIFGIIVLIGVVGYLMFFTNVFRGSGNARVLEDPTKGLTIQEAVAQFDEGFVTYLLYAIGAGNLHNPPFSSDKPRIKFLIDEDVYSAVVDSRVVFVSKNAIESEDAIIKTTKEEAVNMIRNKNYIAESFRTGKSSMELVASKTTLFTKGYLEIYNSLTKSSE